MVVDLNKLAAEIHEAAVKRGFWDIEDAEEKHLAKMISELGEVVQADRAGVMYEIERDGAKPEGAVAELADFVMMALDYAVQMGTMNSVIDGWDRAEFAERTSDVDLNAKATPAYRIVIAVYLSMFHVLLSLMQHAVKVDELGAAVYIIASWCSEQGFDLWEVIRQKMAYNESRPALHGRKY